MFAHTHTDGSEPGLDVMYTEMQDWVLNHISFERQNPIVPVLITEAAGSITEWTIWLFVMLSYFLLS